MAGQDSGFPVEGFSIPLQLGPKKRKRNIDACVICQNNCSNEVLRKGKESSVSVLLEASGKRNDKELKETLLETDYRAGIFWDSKCYAAYTSSQNIRCVKPEQESLTDGGNRLTRSQKVPIDWAKCFICKNKTYKKCRELVNLCTFEACESVRRAAEKKGDDLMLYVINSVNGDLIAAEAKYHKNCFALYVSKRSSVKHPTKEETQDLPHEEAFQELADMVTIGIDQGI